MAIKVSDETLNKIVNYQEDNGLLKIAIKSDTDLDKDETLNFAKIYANKYQVDLNKVEIYRDKKILHGGHMNIKKQKALVHVLGNFNGWTIDTEKSIRKEYKRNGFKNWQNVINKHNLSEQIANDKDVDKDIRERNKKPQDGLIFATLYKINAETFISKKKKEWSKVDGIAIDRSNQPFNFSKFAIDKKEIDELNKLKEGDRIIMKGHYAKNTYNGNSSEYFEPIDILRTIGANAYKDNSSENGRYELSAHTNFSQMECSIKQDQLFRQAAKIGLAGIGLTDSSSAQGYANSINASENYKHEIPLFGVQLNELKERPQFVINPNDIKFINDDGTISEAQSFVAFDIETTGFSPIHDDIIQMSAVRLERIDSTKMKGKGKNRHSVQEINYEVVDKLDEFVHTDQILPEKITNLTHITQDDVDKSKISQEQAVIDFVNFANDVPNTICIGHNVVFDYHFINQKLKDSGHDKLSFEIFDTLPMARRIVQNSRAYNLTALSKKLHIKLEKAHNSLYDCETTGRVFFELISLATRGIQTPYVDLGELKKSELKKKEDPMYEDWKSGNDIHNSEPSSHTYQEGFPYHIDLLAKDQKGIKDLYELISTAHVKHFYREPRIFLSEINARKENGNHFLFGSGDKGSLLYEITMNRGYDEGIKIAKEHNFDYIEIVPYTSTDLVEDDTPKHKTMYKDYINNMLKIAKEINAIPVVISDAHYLTKDDRLSYDILKGIDYRQDHKDMSLRSAESLKKELSEFIDDEKVLDDIVINNTQKIAKMIDSKNIHPIKYKLTPPELPGAEDELRERSWKRVHELYGEKLPKKIEDRVNKELDAIIHNGYAVIYLVAKKLVDISNSKGYLVGSRGSVGGSFVAYLIGITEVNSLQPHYRSKYGDYYDDNVPKSVQDGFDLPPKEDPNHPGEYLIGDGHGCTFEIFTGVSGKKVPDIDLNFASEIQSQAQLWLKNKIFDSKHAYRVGTVGTLADKSSFGLVKKYEREHNVEFGDAKVNYLTDQITGTKKTSGQHAAGVLIVPQDKDITDFTPYTYPANDTSSPWLTTQLTKEMIHDSLLKMDCLGHDDPSMLHYLQEMTGIDPKSINQLEIRDTVKEAFKDKEAVKGLPEFGTGFSSQIVQDTKPQSFSDLVQVSGISHGKGVWMGNAQDLISSGKATLNDVIASRDKIMNDMMKNGWPLEKAFKLVSIVKKQKEIPQEMQDEINQMEDIPDWYVESLKKVKYLYPSAHAVAYVYSAVRIAWYKLHYPREFYASYMSYRIKDKKFDMNTILTNDAHEYDKVINNKDTNASIKQGLEIAKIAINTNNAEDKDGNEYYAKTIFAKPDLNISEAVRWKFNLDDGKTYPGISTIDNISANIAEGIVKYRDTFKEAPRHSKELKDFGIKLPKKSKETLIEQGYLED